MSASETHRAGGPPRRLRIALAGQPNVGKSTVFNALTGLDQHVGNWPGKTVERKIGHFEYRRRRPGQERPGRLEQAGRPGHLGRAEPHLRYHPTGHRGPGGREHPARPLHEKISIELVDLPGTYTLTSGSEEERIARDYLLKERPDAVIAIVNAASLERNLYLVAELLMLPVPVVVGVNMVDVAEAHGIHVEAPVLAAALGLPVVELVASKRKGLEELVEAAVTVAEDPGRFRPNRPAIRAKHRPVLAQLEALLQGRVPPEYPVPYLALKLLEGDTDAAELVKGQAPDVWEAIHPLLARHEDAYLDIAGGRYDWVARMVRAAVVRPRRGPAGLTDRVDRVATHPVWGLLALLVALAALFWITYQVAGPASRALGGLIAGGFSDLLRDLLSFAPAWIQGLIVDGAVAGAGTVLSFIPILVIFFAALGLLEDVGYMARIAYVMDRYMHWMGLHGKSCMPLLLGFGCNVPAILGTRIIEERRARLLTMMLTPFVPCTGRLAVLAFLTPAFFGAAAPWALVGLVGGNLVLLAVVGVAVNRLVFKGERSAFIMEMPLYHVPNARTIALYVWRNTLAFLRKAGTVIVVVSAGVWVLSNFPGESPGESVLGLLGRALSPFFALMGLGDWRLIVALLSSFVAKENSVATLGVLFGAETGVAGPGLAESLAGLLVPAAAVAFLVVQMTFVPCVATVAAIRHETRSWRWTSLNLGLMLVLALLLGVIVFQVGSLFA
jgi:ferrous iron transport protein B